METKVEKITLPDGRTAERHTTVLDNGDRTIEVYAEEKRPLMLETRITEKHKTVVAEQVIETIHDGNVVEQKVLAEPDVKLEVREHIATVDKPELNSNRYVTREDISNIVTDAVVAGVKAQMVAQAQQAAQMAAQSERPLVTKAQQAEMALKERVVEKKKNSLPFYVMVGLGVVVELVALGYLLL